MFNRWNFKELKNLEQQFLMDFLQLYIFINSSSSS